MKDFLKPETYTPEKIGLIICERDGIYYGYQISSSSKDFVKIMFSQNDDSLYSQSKFLYQEFEEKYGFKDIEALNVSDATLSYIFNRKNPTEQLTGVQIVQYTNVFNLIHSYPDELFRQYKKLQQKAQEKEKTYTSEKLSKAQLKGTRSVLKNLNKRPA